MSDLGGTGRYNLPYEDVPGGPVDVPAPGDGWVVATAINFRAGVIKSPMTGQPMAVLIWDFAEPDGSLLEPIMLLLEDDDLLTLSEQVRKAVRGARRGAGRG